MALSLEEQSFADRTIAAQAGRPGALLGILERVQEHHPHKYLSPEMLEYVAAKTDVPLAQIYCVVTFYALFNLEPQGDHTICICRGTACHTRGSRDLLERLRLELGLPRRARTAPTSSASPRPTASYSLRTVACFGQCALAPVVEVDHAIFGHVNEQALHREVEAPGKGEAASDPHSGYRHLQRGARSRAGQAAARRARASPSAWAPAAPATAPRASTTPSPKPSTSGAATCGWPPSAASASAPQEPLVNVWLPGQPLVILRRVQANDVDRILDDLAAGTVPDDLALCKIEEWDHLTAHVQYGDGLSRTSRPGTSSVLQAAEEDRPAQLRPDQPGRHRGVHRGRRLPGPLQGADRRQPGGGHRADQGRQAARPRRRRLPHRPQVGVPAQGRGRRRSTSSATPTRATPAPT